MKEKSFKENNIFLHEKDSRFNSLNIRKSFFFSLDKYQSKIWVENSVYMI